VNKYRQPALLPFVLSGGLSFTFSVVLGFKINFKRLIVFKENSFISNCKMKSLATLLDQVVVVGYGTGRKDFNRFWLLPVGSKTLKTYL